MRTAADDERTIGIGYFLTDTDGTGGRLRDSPEDFVVREQSRPPPAAPGPWTIATITSRNWETNHLVRELSRQLRISRTAIGFAGTKDKRAVTSQLMAFRTTPGDLGRVHLDGVTIGDPYTSRKGLALGDLQGNEFEIIARGCPGRDLAGLVAETTTDLRECDGGPNFFGVQRFGSVRPVTHLVGEQIVRGDLRGAVLRYLGAPSPDERQDSQEARRAVDAGGAWKDLLARFPPHLNFERVLLQRLTERAEDFRGALRALPKNLVMMFVHAYQSYLFNRILSERIARGIPLNDPIVGDIVVPTDRQQLPRNDDPIPVTAENIGRVAHEVKEGRAFITAILVGPGTKFAEGEMGEIEHGIVEEEDIAPTAFSVPELPEASSRGMRREVLASMFPLHHEVGDGTLSLRFRLNRGCYATSVLREYMKGPLLSY